jgi:ABC-type sugar transport system ATPase subunit
MNRTGVVELTGLVKSFRTAKAVVHAVRGVNLVIQAGEVVALLGPNGAGKSTTIDMLLGLARPDVGTVWPTTGLGFSYVPNAMVDGQAPDPRAEALLSALSLATTTLDQR